MFLTSRRDARGGPHRAALIATLTVVLGLSACGLAMGATYYVDNQHPNRSIVGPGTEAQPYSTISGAVATRGGPGVTIIVKPGVYREQITPQASGASGSPFVLRAQGPGVVVDGADDFAQVGRWSLQDVTMADGDRPAWTASVWLARDVTWNPSQVFVDGVRLSRAAAVPEQLPVNAFTWVSGQGLYVNVGDSHPGLRATRVGRRNHGFNLFSKSWIVIEGFEITGTEDRAINLQAGCADLVIAKNRISFANGYGILSTSNLRVQIEENTVTDGRYHGIGLVSGTTGCTVSNNESARNADPGLRRATGIYLFNAPANTLVGNMVHHNQDSGVQLGSGSNDCIVYNNRSWSNGDHGYDHLNTSGTVHLHNVAYRNRMDGFSIEGNSPNTQMHNCISVENGLATGQFAVWLSVQAVTGLVSDYNIFWNSTGQDLFKLGIFKVGSLAEFRGAAGQDAHSIQADPMFVDGPAGDFTLLAGSPAIDAGTSDVPFWPATDAIGNVRVDDLSTPNKGTGPVDYVDIGALEFGLPAESQAVALTLPAAQDPTAGETLGARQAAAERAGTAGVAFSNGFPNPSRGAVEFTIDLVEEAQVEWAVYDLQGRMIWSEGRSLGAGRTVLRWDGTGRGGEPAATGVYLMRARVEGAQITRRVVRI